MPLMQVHYPPISLNSKSNRPKSTICPLTGREIERRREAGPEDTRSRVILVRVLTHLLRKSARSAHPPTSLVAS